ncbi:MAG: 4-alpha-glucanotransferase [Lewinellaceae bacterium]|nr:4-alpha-glucanotransferase [Saprospiraceae bacterium]MCB9331473.1 4-alpha-glucanotransferase [Lewinellaceae bacterium]
MKIHFHLYYSTQYGENLSVNIEVQQGNGAQTTTHALTYLDDTRWHGLIEKDVPAGATVRYWYSWQNQAGQHKTEWGQRLLEPPKDAGSLVELFDYWNPTGAVENAFETQAFQVLQPKMPAPAPPKTAKPYTHSFNAKAPLLQPDEVVCLLGHGNALRNWDSKAPLLLKPSAYGWSLQLDMSAEDFPLAYKYGVWNTRSNSFEGFEDGSNRALFAPKPAEKKGASTRVVVHDGFARFPNRRWRGAGVAIPVFSLRSKNSFGVGEFTDLPALADWAQAVGLKLIQLLPINDTTATHTWTDSYPYAAISAFALHPIYLNVAEVAGKAQAALLKPYAKTQQELNAAAAVDYEGVLQSKWAIIKKLYAAQKTAFLTDTAFIHYFTDNQHWLVPYAAFCYLRDKHGTSDFNQWPEHRTYEGKAIEKLVSPKSAHYDDVAIHYYVQWQLHRQLKAAADYIHAKGLVLKGDIPIGIYRYSCDAWVAPELYNMDMQAGAPPDDFAVNGQNWGFPTYNWARMKADDFAWWRQRFQQMSLYFDAFRIDHILGFFRIWSIPLDAVEGILGYFVPAIPVLEREFHKAGAGFNYDRLCKPFINDQILGDYFGGVAEAVRDRFFDRTPDAGHWSGGAPYVFKPEFDTQQKLESWFNTSSQNAKKKSAKSGKKQVFEFDEHASAIKQGLLRLHSNIILIEVTPDAASEKQYAFRINMEKTSSFQYLPDEVKETIKALYLDYFYRRQDDFWQAEAMEKLPALKRATNMLVCGEDLGMVPHCVPDVMRELGILSLEIQRMPKQTGIAFFNPADAPYLSVVTPSTHDMSTLRGWWEEDRELIQRFFNELLGYEGAAPYFCEPWICRKLLEQHLQAPAMWAIFQLQDLLGMDGDLRREDPQAERINIPADPKHYWRYRMHLGLEDLQKASGYNDTLLKMVKQCGR